MGDFWAPQNSIIYIGGQNILKTKTKLINLKERLETEMDQQKNIAKKVIILYVLNVLRVASSIDTPVTQTTISNYLNDINIPCDRKTVGRNIQYLCEFGYPIKRVGKGYYLDKDELKIINTKNMFVI